MSKNYTNLVVFGGAFCMIFLSAFYMYQVINDTEALTNAQKLWKSIPAMAISFMGVAIFVQRLLHQKEDKELNKERKEQQEKTNNLQEENNKLREIGIEKDQELIKETKEHTKEIHSFGKLLNENVSGDNKTRRLILELTNTIKEDDISRNEESRLMKLDIEKIKLNEKTHKEDHVLLKETINTIQSTLEQHIEQHKQKVKA